MRVRSQKMIEVGLLQEVNALVQRYSPNCKALQSVGYRECLEYLGLTPIIGLAPKTEAELVDKITQSTLRLAKRQMTWFRGEAKVEWLRGPLADDFLPTLRQRLLLE
jgi:tRNA dimethylallyltransferase